MQTQILKTSDEKAISLAVEYIQSGKIVAFPTDTVYGIGVSVKSIEGITQLYIVKRREKHKAIPLLIGKIEDLETIAGEISFDTQKLADAFWPGALTLVVPRNPALPENLSPYPTVGVRMPDHLFILSLLKKQVPWQQHPQISRDTQALPQRQKYWNSLTGAFLSSSMGGGHQGEQPLQ